MAWSDDDEELLIPTARRVQTAIIALLSIICGGQRAEFVHRLHITSLLKDGNGYHLRLEKEKTTRLMGTEIPVPTHVAEVLSW